VEKKFIFFPQIFPFPFPSSLLIPYIISTDILSYIITRNQKEEKNKYTVEKCPLFQSSKQFHKKRGQYQRRRKPKVYSSRQKKSLYSKVIVYVCGSIYVCNIKEEAEEEEVF